MSIQCPSCLSENAPGILNCSACGSALVTEQITYHLLPETILVNKNKQYKIEKTLAEGGFGITYQGIDLQTHKKIAIKENWPENGIRQGNNIIWPMRITPQEKNEQIAQVLKEAQYLEQNSHPNIVKVYDYFQGNNTAYIIMEFLEGKSLENYCQEQGKLTEIAVKKYFLQIAEALKYIHSKNLLHRDIKPDNIIVTPEDKAVLIDFGNAREFINNKTQKMTKIVSEGYAPLEQYSATGRRGPALDIYACCATMYRVLTGQMPPNALERRHEDCLIAPRKINPNIDPYLEQVILTGLAIKVEDRLQSADGLISALQGKLITPALEKARQLVKHNQLTEAIKAYNKCLEDQPNNGEIAIELALILINQEQDRPAEIAANQAIKLEPHDGRGYGVLGLIKCRQGNFQVALLNLEKAAKYCPNQSWIQANLAWALGKQEKWEQAQIAAEKAIQLDNQSDFALALQAWINLNIKNYKNTIRYARQSLHIAKQNGKTEPPQRIWLYPCLTLALSKALVTQLAPDLDRCLQEFITQMPQNTFAWGFKAFKEAKIGLWKEALFSTSNARDPLPSWSWFNQAIIYENLRDFTQALQTYQNYDKKYPNQALVLFRLGTISAKLNQWDSAKTYLQKAIKLKPDFAEAHHNLGWVYQQLRKPSGELLEPRSLLSAYRLALQYYTQQQKCDEAEAIKNAFGAIEIEL